MYRICLVEDEININNLIKSYLQKEGYDVVSFYNGTTALNYNEKTDLWILDIMLSDDVSGYDIIKKIRSNDSNTPVIFTSARDKEIDKIIGLELGSDDYITKPYSPKELVLRVNNIIKRVYSNKNELIDYENYKIDLLKRIVKKGDKEIELTTLEFDLLVLLLKNQNKSFSRDEILKMVWGDDYFGNDRVVDDLVRRLRKKMPNIRIKTIYGFGYRLV